MDDLARVSIPTLASHAQKLVRMGAITGEAALALIIWPDPQDMIRHLELVAPDELEKEPYRIAA